MTANNNEKTVFLTSSNDWELWDLQFQAQAIAGNLWDQIQGLAPFLGKPTAPDLAKHKHKSPSSQSAAQSTITARGSLDPGTEEDPRATPATGSSSSTPIQITDLTADGFRTFQLAWTIYQSDLKEYNQ